MKRTLIYALTITAIALIGCSKEAVKTSATGMTLIANVNEPETSKATISDSWKFSFTEGDVVKVTNSSLSGTETYYTFTKGATNFTSEDAQTTSEDADWYAFFPGTSIDLTDQGGTMDNAADCFGYAGKQTSVEAHSKTLNITMSPKMSIIKVVNNKGSISLNAKNSNDEYITGMTASIDGESGDGPTFIVTTSSSESNLLSKTETGTFYIAVPSQTEFDIYDGTTKLKSIASDKLVAGKYYTLTIVSSTTDLSKDGNANCYIVSTAGTYKFKATVKGNSTKDEDKITPIGVEVLWESFGTAVTPIVGDLVKNVTLADGYVTFTATDKKGNAVIAVKGGIENEILWSWHIWLTDAPSVQTYNNSAGKMMDRNLGATNATKGDVGALGLLYQWGRKDPFLSGDEISYSYEYNQQQAASTIIWPDAIAAEDNSSDATLNLRKSIANPTTFIKNTGKKTKKDWYCTNSSYKNDNLWKSSKTIYDPCPVGYRVPDGGSSGVWSNAFNKSSEWMIAINWDGEHMGMDFGKTDTKLVGTGSDTCWYPAAGSCSSGSLAYVGYGGYYWSCAPTDICAYDLCFVNSGNINPSRSSSRVSGQSVRCLSESK